MVLSGQAEPASRFPESKGYTLYFQKSAYQRTSGVVHHRFGARGVDL